MKTKWKRLSNSFQLLMCDLCKERPKVLYSKLGNPSIIRCKDCR